MRIRTISEIGALWPACTECHHIAQEHDDKTSCSSSVKGQCPTCGTQGMMVKCLCTGYKDMTYAEWFALLTPAEIKHYGYNMPGQHEIR